MTREPAIRFAGGLLMVALLSGCTGRYESTFTVIVENRITNPIQVQANGSDVGQVAPGQSGTFNLELSESNSNVFTNGVAPTPQAQVTFIARDVRSGALSSERSVTLSSASATFVSFSAADFPASAPTVARFTFSPTNPGINQDIAFNASTTTPSAVVTSGTFRWDFGDGQTGTGVTINHPYNRAGTFTVTLIATSDGGSTGTSSRTITVSASLAPASANFTFSPTAPAINQDVVFMAIASPGVTAFFWDFGDGTAGTGATPTHRFTRAGTFTVTLRVANDIGQSATTARPVAVSANLPAGSVSFVFSPTTPGINDIVFFNASTSTVANPNYRWDFGDGSTGSGVTTTHQYARPGTYAITLTVSNDLGQSASAARTITVSSTSTQLVADFTFSPTDPTIARGTNTVIFDATPSSAGAAAW